MTVQCEMLVYCRGAKDAMTAVMLGNALFPLPGTPFATEAPIDLGATQNAWFGQYFAPKLTTDYRIMLNIDSKSHGMILC